MFIRRTRLKCVACLVAGLMTVPLVWLWISAPADPQYKGVRLSSHLYRTYGQFLSTSSSRFRARKDCENALRELGPKATPLLRAWIENRPSPMLEKLRSFLRRKEIVWPYLTADRQEIVERLFFSIPEAAVPLSDAFQWQILNGEAKDATRAATLLMFIINSVDTAAREKIASRSGDFTRMLLDRFETDKIDRYALTLVGPLLQNSPKEVRAELRDRITILGKKSRYLEGAVRIVNSPPAVTEN
jgi:hypothetical protein